MRQQRERLSRAERRRAWVLAALIVLGMAVVAAAALFIVPRLPAATYVPENGALVTEAAAGLDEITVDAVFSPDGLHHLTATQTLVMTNRTGHTQTEAVLRSYTGAYLSAATSPAGTEELFDACYGDAFRTGGLLVDSAAVNGEAVAYAWGDAARTVLTLPLPQPWTPWETITVTLTWHAAVPDCASRFGQRDGVWALGNLFPLPAVWEDGAWRTDAYLSIGDPFLSECANWHVTLTSPTGYTAAATGYAEPETQGDSLIWRWDAPAVRDFTVVLSRAYQRAAAMEGDTLVVAYARSQSAAAAMVQSAAKALRCYGDLWGAYVYPTLTLCEVGFPFSGMEYPRLILLGEDTVSAGGDTLSLTVAHETAHQWWAIQVGSDSWYQAWQDESLAVYAQMDYIGQVYGASSRASAIDESIESALRISIPRDITPGSPLDAFASLSEYSLVVYNRGAALWVALEHLMGREGLDAALRDYQTQYRFRLATRQNLTDILSAHAGMDVSALMRDYLDTEIIN